MPPQSGHAPAMWEYANSRRNMRTQVWHLEAEEGHGNESITVTDEDLELINEFLNV